MPELHQERLDVFRNLPTEKRIKLLQLSVVYPKTTPNIRTEMAICEGKYSGDLESFQSTIKEILQNEKLLVLGMHPSIRGVLQGIASDGIGFGLDAVDYIIIQHIGTFIVRLENISRHRPHRRMTRSGRTLFVDVISLHHAARMVDSVAVENKNGSYNSIIIGMGILGIVPIVIRAYVGS